MQLSKKHFLFILTAIFTFAMHFYASNTGGEALQLPFNAITLALTSLLVFTAFLNINQSGIRYDEFSKALLFFILLVLLPYLWSDFYPGLSESLRFIAILLGSLLYLSLLQINKSNSFYLKLLLLITLASLIEGLLSLYQYYLFTSYFYNFDLSYGRPYGVFQQPNVLASFLVTGLSVSLFILSQYTNLTAKIKAFLYFNSLISIWVTLLCESRVGYITLGIVILFYLLTQVRNKKLKKTLLLLVLLSTSLAYILPYKGEADDQGRKYSATDAGSRIYIYEDTLNLILKKPILGYGYGSFHNALLGQSAIEAEQRNNTNIAKSVAHPHNELLYWYLEGGVITLIAFILLITALAKNIFHTKKRVRGKLLLLLVPILFHLQVELPFYHSIPHFIVFIILLAFINSKSGSVSHYVTSKMVISAIKILTLILFILVTVFSISAIHTSKQVFNYVKTQNYKYLNAIINPISDFKSINILSKSTVIEEAILTNNRAKLIELVNWSNEFLSVYPSAYLRYEKIRMLKQLGSLKLAENETKIAKYLYPQYIEVWNTGVWLNNT
ncbi:Wzy polymerase domain-containing protein [Pseudoalteromonas sp. 20-MNA-CIBAN-0454]|uniref:PglL family O-oligosaccharyltransferase n=1 Tax=Pseudoalteromonas sp. 20-MNA-CIBAN-0454 TaxID=3140424 RepID=UPI00332BB464